MLFPEQRSKAIHHLCRIYESHINMNCYETRSKFGTWLVNGFAGVSSFSDSKILSELNYYSGRQREGHHTWFYSQMDEVDQILK